MKALKQCFTNKQFLIAFFGSIILLSISLVANYYAGNYATVKASSSVTDLILDNIPVFDVDGIFIYGAMLLWVFLVAVLLKYPHKSPFTLYCVSLFVLIRSVFISLTHLGPFPTHMVMAQVSLFDKLTFGGDLFFSGHTGLPYLLALIFWDHKIIRWVFLISSVLFAVVVLLAHVHYSIDVFAAYFITYSIFHLAQFFFKKHKHLFIHGVEELESFV
jgi:hypothetical protein